MPAHVLSCGASQLLLTHRCSHTCWPPFPTNYLSVLTPPSPGDPHLQGGAVPRIFMESDMGGGMPGLTKASSITVMMANILDPGWGHLHMNASPPYNNPGKGYCW